VKLPRSNGALVATPGHYYYTAIYRKVPDRPLGQRNPIVLTLVPNSIFRCEEIVKHGNHLHAKCVTHPHEAVFYIRVSTSHLLEAGYNAIKSPLILLAMQGDN